MEGAVTPRRWAAVTLPALLWVALLALGDRRLYTKSSSGFQAGISVGLHNDNKGACNIFGAWGTERLSREREP